MADYSRISCGDNLANCRNPFKWEQTGGVDGKE